MQCEDKPEDERMETHSTCSGDDDGEEEEIRRIKHAQIFEKVKVS